VGAEDEVNAGNQEADAAHEAAVADGLRILTELVTGYQPADDAEAEVVKAAAESVLPFRRRHGG